MALVPPELKRRFDERVSPHHGLKQARIGAVIGGQQVVQAPGRQGWVYVTLTEPSDVGVTEAINLSTRWAYGAPVYVRRGPRGHMEVIGVDAAAAVSEAGNSATMLSVPDVALTGIVDERRFEPLLVVAKQRDGAYTMSVYIYSGWYWTADGTRRYYPGGWCDLTSYVASAGKRRFALVGINTATNTAEAVAGSEYGLATALTEAQLAEIDEGDVLPLAGVNLPYGTTAVTNEVSIIDARLFQGMPGSGSGTVAPPSAGAWNPDLTPETPNADDDEFDGASLAADWTEVDPDSVLTVTEADGALTLATSGYSDDLTGIKRDVPAGSWQAVVKLATRIAPTGGLTADWLRAGFALTFPTYTGNAVADVQRVAVGDNFLHYGVSSIAVIGLGIPDASGGYLRLRYDAVDTAMRADWSLDGITWVSQGYDLDAVGEAPSELWLTLQSDGTAEVDFEFFRVRDEYGTSTDPVYGRNEDVSTGAANVSYTPTTGGDWTDPDPTTVQDALDELAARVKALE